MLIVVSVKTIGFVLGNDMSVELAALKDFVGPALRMTNDEFIKQYPGIYLVAMGALDVDMYPQNDVNMATSEMVLSFDIPKHGRRYSSLSGRMFVISDQPKDSAVTLGRQPSSSVMIPDNSVSSAHARLRFDSSKTAYLQDLASKNGTSVNNTPIDSDDETKIRDGDLLTFGRYSFQFFHSSTLHAALRLLR